MNNILRARYYDDGGDMAGFLCARYYNDGGDMAAALDTALRMPPQEQRERMRLMRQQVREQNVYRWAGRMLIDAAPIRRRQRILGLAGQG